MPPTTTRIRPAELNFANFTEVVKHAKGQLPKGGGEVVLDMGGVPRYDTASICFIIELARTGKARACQVRVENIGEPLANLMSLYRFDTKTLT